MSAWSLCRPLYATTIQSDPNTTRVRIHYRPIDYQLNGPSPKLSNDQRNRRAPDFLRRLSVSSVLILGLGLSSFHAICSPAWAHIPAPIAPHEETQDIEEEFDKVVNIEDEETKAAFDMWKSKTYALTVPLKIVALEGSLPPIWIREFLKSQGKRVKFQPVFRRALKDIFHELSNPLIKGKINPKSAAVADIVTLGDSWLNFAIQKRLIEPMKGADDQDWFKGLSERWKVYLRRSSEGDLDSQGRIWAVPYRWGSVVIAYNKKEFEKRKLAPIEDWSDLWRPELSGKISMVDSPREIVGAVLKCMGASYNSTSFDSQVVGGKNAVLRKLESLVTQVRLFDSQHYLKAFKAGDVWVAVGWSDDVIPAAKVLSNIRVIVPKSGSSLWADLWAVPNVTTLAADQIGGRVRGPSPLVHQWIEFCLQADRSLPFKEEIIAGASPISLDVLVEKPPARRDGRPKLDTNLIANVPPPEILAKCDFLAPLSEDASSDYKWLLGSIREPSQSFANRMQHLLSFFPKVKSEVS